MSRTLMNNANIWSEAQGTNVRWNALALACLVVMLWMAACGDGSAEEQPFVAGLHVEEQPAGSSDEQPVIEKQPAVDAEPVVGKQPSAEVLACLATGTENNLLKRAAKVLTDYSYLFDRPPYWGDGVSWWEADAVFLTAEYHDDHMTRDEEGEKFWERIRGQQDSGIEFNYVRDRSGVDDLLTITDEDGETQVVVGIVVPFSKWAGVDQNRLPPEHRISDCLEGVPVQLLREGRYTTY